MEQVAVERFVASARAYCDFIENPQSPGMVEHLGKAAVLLAELYAAGLSLPDVEPGDDEETAGAVAVPDARWSGPPEFESYWTVFDPYVLEEPVSGSLPEDLQDVYRDVKEGLLVYELGSTAARREAIWLWRLHLATHWGDHAVDALRALQRAVNRARGLRA